MKVAIIGSGNVGSAVAKAAKNTGHEVIVADLEGTESLDALNKELGVETTNSKPRRFPGIQRGIVRVG